MQQVPRQPGFTALFTPKLLTVLREGYDIGHFRKDMLAGLTVAIVALPLSMAIAIASGASPERGLYAAVVGGFLVSLLGGSRFQIGGPAGAFIVLVAATAAQHGIDGVLIATFLAGLLLLAMGLLQLGTYIKFIPYPVTVGFTGGIAVIIFASQIRDLFGLTLSVPEPGHLIDKIPVLIAAADTVNLTAVGVTVAALFIILGLKKIRPGWPGMLVGVVGTSVGVWMFNLPVETIGSHFGGLPSGMPMPGLPEISWEKVRAVLPDAAAFALLGAIESLLSAVVADGMTGRRHRSNCELVAQGFANIGASLFGGICVTGTIARTATNVRAGAHGPVAGMLHAVFLLVFLLIAAPLATYIPLASLAAVLAIVAWNMIEKRALYTLLRSSRGDALVLLVTFCLTVLRDLTTGIVVGFALGSVLFIHRMSQKADITAEVPLVSMDRPDGSREEREPYDSQQASNPGIIVYRISGALFFGAASIIGSVLERISDKSTALILDFSAVPFLDSTGAVAIESMVRTAKYRGLSVFMTGVHKNMQTMLAAHDVNSDKVRFFDTIPEALAEFKKMSPSPDVYEKEAGG